MNIEKKGLVSRASEILSNEPQELSKSFRMHSRDKLMTVHSHVSKKSFMKKLWHKAPELNIITFKH